MLIWFSVGVVGDSSKTFGSEGDIGIVVEVGDFPGEILLMRMHVDFTVTPVELLRVGPPLKGRGEY